MDFPPVLQPFSWRKAQLVPSTVGGNSKYYITWNSHWGIGGNPPATHGLSTYSLNGITTSCWWTVFPQWSKVGYCNKFIDIYTRSWWWRCAIVISMPEAGHCKLCRYKWLFPAQIRQRSSRKDIIHNKDVAQSNFMVAMLVSGKKSYKTTNVTYNLDIHCKLPQCRTDVSTELQYIWALHATFSAVHFSREGQKQAWPVHHTVLEPCSRCTKRLSMM